MPASNEPRNGDFVAYLEQLQRESAARVLAQSKPPMVQHPEGGARLDHSGASPAEATALTRLQADELLARLASHRASAALIGPAIGVVFGAALLLYWIVGRVSLVTLLIGVGLMVWSIRRLLSAARGRPVSPHATQTLVSRTFGKPPSA